jgi:hypothetical protein
MLGDSRRGRSGAMAHAFCVEDPIPKDHILRRIDAVLDTSWVWEEVAGCYGATGCPSWDPEVIERVIRVPCMTISRCPSMSASGFPDCRLQPLAIDVEIPFLLSSLSCLNQPPAHTARVLLQEDSTGERGAIPALSFFTSRAETGKRVFARCPGGSSFSSRTRTPRSRQPACTYRPWFQVPSSPRTGSSPSPPDPRQNGWAARNCRPHCIARLPRRRICSWAWNALRRGRKHTRTRPSSFQGRGSRPPALQWP